MGEVATPTSGLKYEAEAFLTSTAFRYLKDAGMLPVAKRIQRALQKKPAHKTVTIVGEVSRGKSSLCNALVNTPNASPQGPDKTTSIPIILGPPTSEVEAGKVLLRFASQTKTIENSGIESWVIQERTSSFQQPDYELPIEAYVAIENSPMGDICVTDSPGIGGISDRSSQIFTNTELQTGVFIVVCDASTSITYPEMEFIRKVCAENEKVIVVITKIDKNLSRYQKIALQDCELLENEIGRNIEVQEVSSLLGTISPDRVSDSDSRELNSLSNIEDLRATLISQFAHLELLPVRNALRIALNTLDQREEQLEEQLQSCDAESSEQVDTIRIDDRLKEINALKSTAPSEVRRQVLRISQRVGEMLNADLTDLGTKWQQTLKERTGREIRDNSQYYSSQFTQDCENTVSNAQENFKKLIGRELVDPHLGNDFPWEDFDLEIADYLFVKSRIVPPQAEIDQQGNTPSMQFMGRTAFRLLYNPVGGLISMALEYGGLKQQSWNKSKKLLEKELLDTLQRAGRAGYTSYEGMVTQASTNFIVNQLKNKYDEEIQSLREQLHAIQNVAKQDASKRATMKKRLTSELEDLREVRDQAEDLLVDINEAIEEAQ